MIPARETACPACGEVGFRVAWVGEVKLYVCRGGCPGRRVASALGERLPEPDCCRTGRCRGEGKETAAT